jgi:hypothetical protein
VNRIVSYREYEEKYELEKYLKQKSTMDSRFFKILKYIDFLSFSPSHITLKEECVSDVEQRVDEFNALLESGKLIKFNVDEPSDYRKMLYSEKDIITYHKSLK